MLRKWMSRWRQTREEAALERRAIADDLWKRTLIRYPFLRRQSDPFGSELRRLASLFLDRKEFVAVGGLRLTNDVAVAVAAQACLPLLGHARGRCGGSSARSRRRTGAAARTS